MVIEITTLDKLIAKGKVATPEIVATLKDMGFASIGMIDTACDKAIEVDGKCITWWKSLTDNGRLAIKVSLGIVGVTMTVGLVYYAWTVYSE